MSSSAVPDGRRLLAAYPQIFTTDFVASRGFYLDRLGFSLVYEYGDPPFYALVGRDDARLNLRFVHRHPMDQELAAAEDLLAANVPVEGVENLYREVVASGDVRIAQPLTRQPWGAQDFVVVDPDGNRLCFASSVETTD